MDEGRTFSIEFAKHFVRNVKCTRERPVLLLLDNHDAHLSIEALNFLKNNGVCVLSFPPHCSHKLQPLDRSVYGPFKKYVNTACDAWMRNHPGSTMTIYDIPGIVNTALPLAVTQNNIVSEKQKRKLKKNKENEETTDEEEWKSEASGSGDEDVDWAGGANPDNFKELERDPKKDDFVLVALVDEANARSKEKFYIAKIVTQGEIRENSVHMTTGVTPSSLIFKHKIRTRLDFLAEKDDKVNRNVINYEGKRDEKFVEGDRVWCRDYRNPNKKEIKDDNKVFSESKPVVPEIDISLPCSSSSINDKALLEVNKMISDYDVPKVDLPVMFEKPIVKFKSAEVQREEDEKKGSVVIKDKTPIRKINDRPKRKITAPVRLNL
ncbi:hypothetical protein NQ314_008039 [Rhamnusium bicolor]|uniref:DDE-1 domain-containing protein n=1 Tax=Rhamnusium bicolor TaxID=1586634 RepID=A0AAV8YGI0_9CUCU|nr:hypothetical protein NQ314_008039 [Rhamnusium bicolor]